MFALKKTPLYVYILSSIVYLFAVNTKNTDILLANKIIAISVIILYYISMANKKINFLFTLTLIFFLISGAFFTLDRTSTTGFYTLLISRIFLFLGIYTTIKSIDKRTFSIVFLLFIFTTFFLFSYVYKNTIRFNIAILIGLFTILIFAFSFNELLKTTKKGNLEMLVGISLFIFCDVIFSLNRFSFFETYRPIIVSIFYHTAYYFTVISMIKKSQVT